MALARTVGLSKLFASRPLFRTLGTTLQPPRTRLTLATVGLVSSTVVGASLYTYIDANGPLARSESDLTQHDATAPRKSPAPFSELLRTYVVYSLCSVPLLVDWSPTVLATLMAVPGVKQITERIVRATFFDQFVGGDAAEDVVPVLERLRAENKGALFVYSVEVDEAQAAGHGAGQLPSPHKKIVEENMHCIDVAADFEDRHAARGSGKGTWVAIKLTALVPDAESLRRMSKYLVDSRPQSEPRVAFPGCPLPSDLDILTSGPNKTVTAADIVALRELREDLIAICERAQERGVRITVDAEHSFYQPAIDAFTLDMMRKFNKLPRPHDCSSSQNFSCPFQPLIYNTFQGYLRRTPEFLAQSIAAARAEGYALGVKLVRGAYHPHELELHTEAAAAPPPSHPLSISPDALPPVWLRKDETDACYNAAVRLLIGFVREDVEACRRGQAGPAIGALFGTHNWESANLVVDELVRQGLATTTTMADASGTSTVDVGEEAMSRVAVSQLYGMSDALTDHLVQRARSSSPFVLKYLPYGSLSEVMPYLGRRAIENKSVLGNGAAALERKRAFDAMWSRIFG